MRKSCPSPFGTVEYLARPAEHAITVFFLCLTTGGRRVGRAVALSGNHRSAERRLLAAIGDKDSFVWKGCGPLN